MSRVIVWLLLALIKEKTCQEQTTAEIISVYGSANDFLADSSANVGSIDAPPVGSTTPNSNNVTTETASERSWRCGFYLAEKISIFKDVNFLLPSIPMRVQVRMVVFSLDDVSDANSQVSLTARFEFSWYNARIQVSDSVAPNCTNEMIVHSLHDYMWFPHFEVLNGAKEIVFPQTWEKYPAIIRTSGFVEWKVPIHIDLSCSFDATLFPFDSQVCYVYLQSSQLRNDQLVYLVKDPRAAVVRFSCDSDHPMWLLTMQKFDVPSRDPGIRFWYRLDRRPSYYAWTIVIPCVATALQTGSTFIIAADGDEKISTAVSGLLGYFFLFIIFSDSTPQTSVTTPLMLMFFAYNIMLSVLAVVAACVVQRYAVARQAKSDEAKDSQPEPKRVDYFRRMSSRLDGHFSPVSFNKMSVSSGMFKYGPEKRQPAFVWPQISGEAANHACLVIFTLATLAGFFTFGFYVAYQTRQTSDYQNLTKILEYSDFL